MSRRNDSHEIEILKGLFLLLLAHIVAIVTVVILIYISSSIASVSPSLISSFAGMLSTVLLFSLFGIGISQWLYVTPLLIQLRRRDKVGLFQGVLIGALLTMLLNGACFISTFTGSH